MRKSFGRDYTDYYVEKTLMVDFNGNKKATYRIKVAYYFFWRRFYEYYFIRDAGGGIVVPNSNSKQEIVKQYKESKFSTIVITNEGK